MVADFGYKLCLIGTYSNPPSMFQAAAMTLEGRAVFTKPWGKMSPFEFKIIQYDTTQISFALF